MLVEEIIPFGKFTQGPLELRMFSKEFPEKVWVEVKELLFNYFMENAIKMISQAYEGGY